MRSVNALRVAPERRLGADSLQQLVVVCLEELADLAHSHGQPRRAARLLDAAALVREPPAAGVPVELSLLTRREWDVASLVARGCSNRQIAEQLVVSQRTVDTHVSHVLRKLGLGSRAQLAVWVVEHSRRLTLLA